MQWVIRVLSVTYAAIAFLFGAAGTVIIWQAILPLWETVAGRGDVSGVIESIGLLAIALVALEIAQTVIEEEVVRRAQVSAPTRVRRYLSRFLVVIVVALSIKYLVAVVRFLDEDSQFLWNASSIGFVAAALLAAWAIFVHLNRSAEELEPEAMAAAKREDVKVE